MADFQEQLQAILGDPEMMGQISSLARALTGGDPSPLSPDPPPNEEEASGFVPVEPEEMSDSGLSPLLSALGGNGPPDLDPRLLSIALKVYEEYRSGDDQKAALLTALKPFLREERREKMERAVQIARLYRVIRTALQLWKEEGEAHV